MKKRQLAVAFSVLLLGLPVAATLWAQSQPAARPPLSAEHVSDIANLLMMEDRRAVDSTELARIMRSSHAEVRRRAALTAGRVISEVGRTLLRAMRTDADTAVLATVVFATGQGADTTALIWFASLLESPTTPPTVATEAAGALGKIRTPQSREILVRFLQSASAQIVAPSAVGEALLSLGRFTTRGDLAPIVRWVGSSDVDIRWRATWALFRPRDPRGVPYLVSLMNDESAVVRNWAVRGLGAAQVDSSGADRASVLATILRASRDLDRTVRTEAIRVLPSYTEEAAVARLREAAASSDSWESVSAAPVAGVAGARAGGAGGQGRAARAAGSGAGGTTAGRGSGAVGRAGAVPAQPQKDLAHYRSIVERWVVPDYSGTARPTAEWSTTRGTFVLELYAGDAPIAMDDFVRNVETGALIGVDFSRVVPDFVAQQRGIPGHPTVRDEVNRHRLSRGNLSWASAGLDTGRPGYTLGHTAQPHNEGGFTSLGRVISGMDVVDRIEQGDQVTAARMTRVAR